MASVPGGSFTPGGGTGRARSKNLLDSLGSAIFGSRVDNEFRDVDDEQFRVPGAQERADRLLSEAERARGRTSEFREDEARNIELLRALATDPSASVAIRQAEDAIGRGVQAQQAAQLSSRGNPATAARTAATEAGQLSGAVAGESARARAEERINAARALTAASSQAREGDISERSVNDRLLEALFGQELQQALAQLQGGIAREGARTSRFGTLAGVPTGQEKLVGGAVSLGQAFGGGAA